MAQQCNQCLAAFYATGLRPSSAAATSSLFRLARVLLSFDHGRFDVRGEKSRKERSSSSALARLSIHPKQSASATASTEATRGLPLCRLY